MPSLSLLYAIAFLVRSKTADFGSPTPFSFAARH